jgi:ubiquinone/menaquinone biosynthesis C-methylase UbiE
LDGVSQNSRERVWSEIATYVHEAMGRPERVLDPAAGRGEFINAIPAKERWAIERIKYAAGNRDSGVHCIDADVFEADLPNNFFDGVFVSNFLEHLPTPEAVARFLDRMYQTICPGGRIAVLGPNFKYCVTEYFDCADHVLPLSHSSVAEHLYGAGFEVVSITPRFLPYSFRGVLPPSPTLTRAYLRFRPAWRILGKQFFVQACKR